MIRRELKYLSPDISSVFDIFPDVAIERPPSRVHTIYFDEKNLKNLQDSRDGSSIRRQFRYRRYDDNKHGKFEIKSTDLVGDSKHRFDIELDEVEDFILQEQGIVVRKILSLTYFRRYYISKKWMCRLTLDHLDRAFMWKGALFGPSRVLPVFNILEVKASPAVIGAFLETHVEAKRHTRISKYDFVYSYLVREPVQNTLTF